MPSKKRQTRRSISTDGLTYQRFRDYCEENGHAMAGLMTELLNDRMDAEGFPKPSRLEPYAYQGDGAKPGPKGSTRHGGMFTW